MSEPVREADEGQTFTCCVCKRSVPWSQGAADDMPEACDDCWCEAHGIRVSKAPNPQPAGHQ